MGYSISLKQSVRQLIPINPFPTRPPHPHCSPTETGTGLRLTFDEHSIPFYPLLNPTSVTPTLTSVSGKPSAFSSAPTLVLGCISFLCFLLSLLLGCRRLHFVYSPQCQLHTLLGKQICFCEELCILLSPCGYSLSLYQPYMPSHVCDLSSTEHVLQEMGAR